MDTKIKKRGRPSISRFGSQPLTTTIPVPLYDHLCRVATTEKVRLSELVREKLLAVQDAVELEPLLRRMQSDRDDAVATAKMSLEIQRLLLEWHKYELMKCAKEIAMTVIREMVATGDLSIRTIVH